MSRTLLVIPPLTLVRLTLYMVSAKMFESIPEIELVIAIAFLVTTGWLACVQWSEFQAHNKKHAGDTDTDTKFAVVPYFLIPMIGAGIAVFASLFVTDYLIIHGYISGVEEIAFTTSVVSVAIYMILDYLIISHVGDATYYRTIESKVYKSADTANIDEEALKLLKKLLSK